jgi:hypothetical protein
MLWTKICVGSVYGVLSESPGMPPLTAAAPFVNERASAASAVA